MTQDELQEIQSSINHPVSVKNIDNAKLIIADEDCNAILTVDNDGHIQTSSFDSSLATSASGKRISQLPQTSELTGAELIPFAYNGENGAVTVNAIRAGIQGSTGAHPVTVEDTDLADLIIADENRRAILSVVGGHIRTANFNSANIQASQPSGSFDPADIDPTMPNPYDKLYDKHWYVLGDSMSEGDFSGADTPYFASGLYAGQKKVYPFYIGNRTGMIVHNLAKCGWVLTRDQNTILDLYQTIPSDADYITIYIGINDSHRDLPIGPDDSSDTSTFSGAYNTMLQWLITNRPYAHIGIIIPPSSNESNWPNFDAATRRAARRFGIPILDIGAGEDIPYFLRQNLRPGVLDSVRQLRRSQYCVSPTNGHPNDKAHLLLSHIVEQFLRRI